jgi:hypothetical protein
VDPISLEEKVAESFAKVALGVGEKREEKCQAREITSQVQGCHIKI